MSWVCTYLFNGTFEEVLYVSYAITLEKYNTYIEGNFNIVAGYYPHIIYSWSQHAGFNTNLYVTNYQLLESPS